jgi:HK97 family phage major capsid protein
MNDELTKLRQEYQAKLAEAEAKRLEFNDGKAKSEEVDALLGQADVIKVKIDYAEKIAAGHEYLRGNDGPQAAQLAWRDVPAGKDEGMPAVDTKAWREIEVKDVLGQTKSFRYFVPVVVQGKGYAPAFEAYIRKGKDAMGPNDKKTLSEGLDTAGGFLVPEDYQTELVKKIAAAAVIRQIARVVQTSRDIVRFPRINYGTDDIYTSGVRLAWIGETPASAAVHRVTDPVFGSIAIDVHVAMASMPLTNSLLEDSAFDVMGVASDLMGEAFALGEDNVFINGTGVGQPMGLLTQAEGDGPAAVHSGSAGTLMAAGLRNLFYGLPAQYRRNARWVMNSATQNVAEGINDTTGRPIVVPLSVASLGMAPFDTIKGKPVLCDEFMPAATAGLYPIAFGDFSGYYIVDRVGLSIQRLEELYAETDIKVLLARKRVGGYCAEPFRFRLQQIGA